MDEAPKLPSIRELSRMMITPIVLGIDLASSPDETAYWHPPRVDSTPNPKKRAKVKAARKQRRKCR
jgi:hypothetical protein